MSTHPPGLPTLLPARPRPARRRAAAALLLALAWPVLAPAQPAPARSGRVNPALAALAQQTLVRLPAPPAWDASVPATVWTIDDLRAEFDRITDTPPQVNHLHNRFLLADHDWMNRFRTWFRRLERPLKIRYEDEVWDCDNYANLFVTLADLLSLQAGETRGSFCIGWASVYYRRAFAGVGAGGAHAVVLVGTSRGLYVIEPQNGTMVPLQEFPNRHTIEEVYF